MVCPKSRRGRIYAEHRTAQQRWARVRFRKFFANFVCQTSYIRRLAHEVRKKFTESDTGPSLLGRTVFSVYTAAPRFGTNHLCSPHLFRPVVLSSKVRPKSLPFQYAAWHILFEAKHFGGCFLA